MAALCLGGKLVLLAGIGREWREGGQGLSDVGGWRYGMAGFQKYIGIDYSGSGTPLTKAPGLQVYVATSDRLPKRVSPPSTPKGQNRNLVSPRGDGMAD